MADHGRSRTAVRQGRNHHSPGDPRGRTYLLKRGTVLVCREHPEDGRRVPIEKLEPGELFGEMYLMSNPHLRNASVVALDEVLVDVFFEESIAQDLETVSPVLKAVFKGLTRRLTKMTDHYVDLTLKLSGEKPEATPGGIQADALHSPDHFL